MARHIVRSEMLMEPGLQIERWRATAGRGRRTFQDSAAAMIRRA